MLCSCGRFNNTLPQDNRNNALFEAGKREDQDVMAQIAAKILPAIEFEWTDSDLTTKMNNTKDLSVQLKLVLADVDRLLAKSSDIDLSISENGLVHTGTSDSLANIVSRAEQSCAISAKLRNKCLEVEACSRNRSFELQKTIIRKANLESRLKEVKTAVDGIKVPQSNTLTESVCQMLEQKRKFEESSKILHCICIAGALTNT